MRTIHRRLYLTGAAAAAYFVGARLGYAFAIPHSFVTLWPPAGVMLALLALNRRRDWPALLAGAIIGSVASDLRSGYSITLALAASMANATESAFAAWILTKRVGTPVRLSTTRTVIELGIGAATIANAVTSWLGAAMLHYGFHARMGTAWLTWWVGDGLGMLLIAPPIIAWASAQERAAVFDRSRWIEAGVVLVGLSLMSHAVFGPAQWPVRPGPYAVFPFLLWAGLRFGPLGATTGSLIVATYATWDAGLGAGPLISGASSTIDTALQVYAFLLVASLCALLPGVALEERTLAERRRADTENRYRESEARHRSVVEAATDAIITIDDRSTIQFANPAAERVFGYAVNELVGRELTMLMPSRFHDRHRAAMARYVATGKRNIEWKGVSFIGLHKDGRELPLEVSFGSRTVVGGHVYTVVLRDVSERVAAQSALREAEDRLRFAMEAARLGVWDVDLKTGEARWSETLETLHGLAPRSFGGTFEAFIEQIYPEDRQRVADSVERATRERTDSRILYRSVWPDRSIHWISGIGRTFYAERGEPERAAGIAFDVTEQHTLEERVRQSQKMDAVGQLAGGIAHDFNNLLTVILNYSSMAIEALPEGHPQRDDIEEIRLAGQRAATLTRQLLAFSRKQILLPHVMNLADSITSIEPMLRRLIGEDVEIGVRIRDVGNVKADPSQIEQIILNLAINARDAMPEGGTLLLELSNVDVHASDEARRGDLAPGRYVMFAVSDTGIGMDAETVSHIFEPFFTTKPLGKGTGLGLATVHGIVKQSAGAIWVYSEVGQGTTIKVVLPRVDEEIDESPAPSAEPAGRYSETILITEDDVSVKNLAARILQRRGYSVLTAATPREALEIAERHAGPIHLLLTDVVLPEMSGRALATQLAVRHSIVRALYMSGYTDDAVVRRGILEHDMTFVQKPFDADALLRKVRDALGKRNGGGTG